MSHADNLESQRGSAELLQWSVSAAERETVVALEGEIDLASAGTLNQLLEEVLAGDPAGIVIDLAKVTFLDSTGIRQLMIGANAASEQGCRFVVRGPSAMIERTLQICGLHDLLVENSSENATARPLAS